MKFLFIIFLFVVLFGPKAAGQDASTDSLKTLLEKAPPDSNRVKLLFKIAETYYFSLPDSCLVYSLPALNLAKELQMDVAEITALNYCGEAYRFLGDFPGALNMQF